MQHPKRTEPRSNKRILVSGAVGLLALGVAGGSAFSAGANSPTITAKAIDTVAPAARAMPGYAASLNLRAMPAGTVSFRYNDGRITARITAIGLTPGSTHLAVITSPVLDEPITLSQFTASPTGQVSATVSSTRTVRRLPLHAIFQIELSTSPAQPIAIANIDRTDQFREGGPLGLVAVEPGAPQPLAGHASVRFNGDDRTLT
ncbi:MAG: hypothetical protein J2P58_06470, partial [Acidimicrobiaceae bacterium]|nr:hypothetical protein [Acidimicrobiaceae bacterium]